MVNKSIKPAERKTPETASRKSVPILIKETDFHRLNEIHAALMALTFFSSAFIIIYYFNITVITLMVASRWFSLFAFCSFIVLYLIRLKLHLTLMDGVFYTLFGVAPLLLALMLYLNALYDSIHFEEYRVLKRTREGSGYTMELADDAYSDFWHIRNLDREESSIRYGKIRFGFCDGLFGYKVMKQREMVP